jgi:hypothetical protein
MWSCVLPRSPILRSGPAILLFAACAGDAKDAGRAFIVRGSAGVEIEESSRPAWRPGAEWRVSAEPRVRIGAVDGEDAYMLHGVTGVVRLGNGRIVVANQGDVTLRYYDAGGRFLRSAGGAGSGPGEVRWLRTIFAAGDRVYVDDPMQAGTLVFDGEGELVGTIVREGAVSPGITVEGVLDDGSLVQVQGATPRQASIPAAGEFVANVLALRTPPEGGVSDSLFSAPGRRYAVIDGSVEAVQFTPWPRFAVAGSHIWYGWAETYDAQRFDAAGRLVRRVRRVYEPLPVTAEDRERVVERRLNPSIPGHSPPDRAQIRRLFAAMPWPQATVAYGEVRVDLDGHLWVLPFTEARRQRSIAELQGQQSEPVAQEWDVFDPRGVWLGTVALPSGLRVHQIGHDWIAGVERDVFDVEYVVLYGLERR